MLPLPAAKITKKRTASESELEFSAPVSSKKTKFKQEGVTDLEVTGISRSGRVRKKSSKLADFESPDELDPRYKRKVDKEREAAARMKLIVTGDVEEDDGSVQVKIEEGEDFPEQDDGEGEYDEGSESGLSGEEDDSMETLHMEDMTEGADDDDNDDETSLVVDESMDTDLSGASKHSTKSDDFGLMSQANLMSNKAQSLYLSEKSTKKRLIVKDGKIVRRKAQRKDKGKSRFTAYMLWAREVRQEILAQNPDMDFAAVSKRLGELWATVPNSEKYNWKRRAKRLAAKGNKTGLINTGRWRAPPAKINLLNKGKSKGNVKDVAVSKEVPTVVIPVPSVSKPSSKPVSTKSSPSPSRATIVTPPTVVADPVVGPGLYKVVGTQPIDVAAHLKLLGESLSIIGERLKEHEGQIAVSGSLSVLLDSLLCALGPLLCLTQQCEETNGCPQETLNKVLDNIAYIMPGL